MVSTASGPVRLHADRERCISAGVCALRSPELFDQDESDGRVLLLVEGELTEQQSDEAVLAAAVCPSGTLSLVTG